MVVEQKGGGHLIALATNALSNDCIISTITVGSTKVVTGTGTPISVGTAKEGRDKGCRSVR